MSLALECAKLEVCVEAAFFGEAQRALGFNCTLSLGRAAE